MGYIVCSSDTSLLTTVQYSTVQYSTVFTIRFGRSPISYLISRFSSLVSGVLCPYDWRPSLPSFLLVTLVCNANTRVLDPTKARFIFLLYSDINHFEYIFLFNYI